MASTAIFYQNHHIQDSEIELVRVSTARESLIQRLSELVSNTSRLGAVNEENTFLTVRLICDIREVTLDFIDSLLIWQRQYVNITRPKLYGQDYLEQMIGRTDFLGSMKIRHMLNFQICRGNIFILPVSNVHPKAVGEMKQQLYDQLLVFATPPLDRIRNAYEVLYLYLGRSLFRRIMPLETWLAAPWTPHKPLLTKLRKAKKAEEGPPSSVVVPSTFASNAVSSLTSLAQNTASVTSIMRLPDRVIGLSTQSLRNRFLDDLNES